MPDPKPSRRAESVSVTIFDFDDTLMATRERRLSILEHVLRSLGHPVARSGILEHWGKPFPSLIHSVAPGVEYERFYAAYSFAMSKSYPVAQPGVEALLTALRERGVTIFVLSSGSRALVRQDLDAGGLTKHIDGLWCCEDTPYHKPDARVMKPILTRLQRMLVPLSRAAYVGDSISDFIVARESGVNFYAVLTGVDDRATFNAAGMESERVFDTLEGIVPTLCR